MQQQLVVAAQPQRRLRAVGGVGDDGTSAVDVEDGLEVLQVALEALLLPRDGCKMRMRLGAMTDHWDDVKGVVAARGTREGAVRSGRRW